LDLDHALSRIPLFMRGQARRGMPREVFLQVMKTHASEFSACVNLVRDPESVEAALSSLSEAGARLYLANASRQPLVLLHTITVPAALRLLLPQLPVPFHKTALAYVWQDVAAIAAAYADEAPSEREDWALREEAEIIERSIETGDPHALKLTEACIREFRSNPRPVYLAAAEDWATRLHRAKDWSSAQLTAAGIDFQ
jgi:hypothetical protein